MKNYKFRQQDLDKMTSDIQDKVSRIDKTLYIDFVLVIDEIHAGGLINSLQRMGAEITDFQADGDKKVVIGRIDGIKWFGSMK